MPLVAVSLLNRDQNSAFAGDFLRRECWHLARGCSSMEVVEELVDEEVDKLVSDLVDGVVDEVVDEVAMWLKVLHEVHLSIR